jgi:aspartate aminotransferase
MVILGSPSNPTGSIYTPQELADLADVVLTHSTAMILSDEIYEKLVYAPHVASSIASVSKAVQDRTVLINGVSKAYSMTGWRIGYSAAPVAISKTMGMIQSHSTSNPMTPAQWASVDALIGPETEVEAMRVAFQHRRDVMVERLNQIPGISCITPHGAFYAFPNIQACLGKVTPAGTLVSNSTEFCQALLKEALVACVPGSGFGAEGYMRLSYATGLTEIETGLSRIHTWVNQLK